MDKHTASLIVSMGAALAASSESVRRNDVGAVYQKVPNGPSRDVAKRRKTQKARKLAQQAARRRK